jgi:hypothetical protein
LPFYLHIANLYSYSILRLSAVLYILCASSLLALFFSIVSLALHRRLVLVAFLSRDDCTARCVFDVILVFRFSGSLGMVEAGLLGSWHIEYEFKSSVIFLRASTTAAAAIVANQGVSDDALSPDRRYGRCH